MGAIGSAEEVARRAGVGISTVFRHFPTKQVLVEATIVRHLNYLVLCHPALHLVNIVYQQARGDMTALSTTPALRWPAMVKRGLTRDALVALAHEYVAANGLDALTMRRLAAAAEVTPGALYKHFRDRKDLQRAMADAIYATIDLSDVDTAVPSVEQVKACCERMRHAMLAFRDGGRIIAGSYAPLAATLKLSATLMALLQAVTASDYSPGQLAALLRSYTTGFVIDEQAFLELKATDEWDSLVQQIADRGHPRPAEADDLIAILTGDRDRRFDTGLDMILTGLVRATPTAPN